MESEGKLVENDSPNLTDSPKLFFRVTAALNYLKFIFEIWKSKQIIKINNKWRHNDDVIIGESKILKN